MAVPSRYFIGLFVHIEFPHRVPSLRTGFNDPTLHDGQDFRQNRAQQDSRLEQEVNDDNDDYEFPFEYWARLATDDPSSFEDARRLMIDSFIASAPEDRQERLRGLQWQIDRVRELTPSPLGACIKISNLMWEKVLGSGGLVENLEHLSQGDKAAARPTSEAIIVPFERPH